MTIDFEEQERKLETSRDQFDKYSLSLCIDGFEGMESDIIIELSTTPHAELSDLFNRVSKEEASKESDSAMIEAYTATVDAEASKVVRDIFWRDMFDILSDYNPEFRDEQISYI